MFNCPFIKFECHQYFLYDAQHKICIGFENCDKLDSDSEKLTVSRKN